MSARKIEFTVHRRGWASYEAMVPEDFDTADEMALLELAESATETESETTHLSAILHATGGSA